MALRDVIGQEKAVNILLRTIQRRRIPSAYLFAGESGIGKKFTALNLAKAINCLQRVTSNELQVTGETQILASGESPRRPNLNPPSPPLSKGGMGGFDKEWQGWGGDCCDECSSCKKIDSGVHPDLLVISPEGGQIRIEEIRSINDTLSLKPFEGRWKVVVVDEASTMNPYAANAFLKTLEEPPKDSLIILVSSNPERLPDTIRSRCSRVNFTPLSYEACKKVIEKFISQQESKVPPTHPSPSRGEGKGGGDWTKESKNSNASRLATLARLSMGRPGLAVSADLLDEREWFLRLLQEMMKAEKEGWTSKEEMEKWFELILILLRDIVITKITKDRRNLIYIDLKEYIKEFSSAMDLKVIIDCYQKLNTLRGYLNFNLNRSLTWNYTGSLLRILKTEH
jgi:DNA polymerase-3 subunit delta'